MINLPIELIPEIVAVLSTPDYPLQYGHKADVKHALLQLSLVNHFLRDIVRPVLHSSIVISSEDALHAFLSTTSSFRRFTTSLWLREFSGKFPMALELIRVLGPSLRRLALDIPGMELNASSAVREALRSCTQLVEFTRSGYSPMQLCQPRPPWPDWIGLRRLALDGPLVDNKFISYIENLPRLTHLALIEPRWRYSPDGTETAIFMKLLVAGKGLEQVLLIYRHPEQHHLNSLMRLKSLNFGQSRSSPQVYYTVMEEFPPSQGMTCGVGEQIGQGTLWNSSCQELLGPLGNKRGLEQLGATCKAQALNSAVFLRETSSLLDIMSIY